MTDGIISDNKYCIYILLWKSIYANNTCSDIIKSSMLILIIVKLNLSFIYKNLWSIWYPIMYLWYFNIYLYSWDYIG